MLRTSFKIGLTFIDGQIRRQIRRRLPTGKIQLEDDNGELLNLTDDELRRYWFSGEWVIDDSALSSLKDALYLAVPRDLGTYPERHQQEALRRQRYIQAINPETTPYNPVIWRAAIEEAARSMEDRNPPCPATVQAWWRRYRNLKSINCLIPHNKPSCGPKAKKRYGIFEDAIAKVYLTKQKLPKLAVVEEVYRQIEAINNGRPSKPPIKKPSRSTIYRWLDDLHQNLVDASREGAEAARMKYRAALGSVKVGSVLERIEIDHMPIDLIDYESSVDSTFGRPWLTVAIDVYSRPMKLRRANELDVSWQVTSLAAEIIFDWPRVFHTALSQLQTLSSGEKMGLMGMFRHAYTYIYKGFPEANFAPLREAFESWLAENWKGGLARRNRRLNDDLLKSVRWIPGNVAATELGVSPARLKFLVKEGMLEGQESVSGTGRSFMVVRRDQLLEIRAKLAEEMPLNEAAERLGLSRARMRQMLRLMFPYARRINDKIHMPWCVPRDEVEVLLKLGCDLPVCSDIGEQRVSLGHVFKYWCWSSAEVVALIQSVRSGGLQPVAMAPDAVGISRWVFEASDLKAFQENCGVSQTDSLSIPDMAQMLGVKQEVAYWLVRHQFVRSEKAGRFSSARVRREDIEDFHERHLFGRDLAMLIGKSPKALVLLLEERGIQPLQADDGEACRQMIYRRDRALSVFLAETGKVSSSEFAGVSITLSESFSLRSSPVNEVMPLNL